MANRSYLYAADYIPSSTAVPATSSLIGISEWNYDIPIAYKLLLSQGTQKCISSIWKIPEEIALVGAYDAGCTRLFAFLDRIANPAIKPLRNEADEFLSAAGNKRRYFILECGEIFQMTNVPLATQNDLLFDEICRLATEDPPIPDVWSANFAAPPRGLLARRLGIKEEKKTSRSNLDSFGLGNWENILYFDPNESE